MTEYGYVEQPILGWLCGEPKAKYGGGGLGWTYRDEAAMAEYERPFEDPLVERLLVASILRINPDVKTEAQAKLAGAALRKTMTTRIGSPPIARPSTCCVTAPGSCSSRARTRRRFSSSPSIRIGRT